MKLALMVILAVGSISACNSTEKSQLNTWPDQDQSASSDSNQRRQRVPYSKMGFDFGWAQGIDKGERFRVRVFYTSQRPHMEDAVLIRSDGSEVYLGFSQELTDRLRCAGRCWFYSSMNCSEAVVLFHTNRRLTGEALKVDPQCD